MTNYIINSLGSGGTVQAAAADASLSHHILSITNNVSFDTRTIESMSVVAAVAESIGSITVTPILVASADYSLVLTQLVNGAPKSITVSTSTPASGGTILAICNDWRAQLAAAGSSLSLVGTGTTTFIVSGKAGSPIVSVKQVSLSSGTSTATVVGTVTISGTGISGTAASGTYAALVAAGVPVTTPIVGGQSYTTVTITGRAAGSAEVAGNVLSSRTTAVLLINQAATNFAALNTRLGEIANGFVAGGTTADPASIAL